MLREIAPQGEGGRIMGNYLPSLWGRSYDPFAVLRRDFDRFLTGFDHAMPTWMQSNGGSSYPAVDMADTMEAIEVSAELPGISEKEVRLTVEGDTLVIAGEKKAEKEATEKDWQVVERSYGTFRRVLSLPFTPDVKKIDATFEKGVLKVKIAKPAELLMKAIDVPVR
jgi:HSP20 family protein